MDIPKKKINDGTSLPVLGLGTWQLVGEKCLQAVGCALKLGYRHIDTAFAYYNEPYIGKAISSFPREKLFLTTKLWRDFHDPKQVEQMCDFSLQCLKASYLDLYLIHWPEKKNMIDTLGAMHKLKEKGKVKSVGICNATIKHLEEILRQKISVSVNQVEFHPFLNQKKLLSFCNQHTIALTAYSPIARGGVFEEKVLSQIGKKHQKTVAQVSLRWLIQKGIVVIPKASSEDHLKENLSIFDFALTEEEMAQIDQLDQQKRLIVPEFNEFE